MVKKRKSNVMKMATLLKYLRTILPRELFCAPQWIQSMIKSEIPRQCWVIYNLTKNLSQIGHFTAIFRINTKTVLWIDPIGIHPELTLREEIPILKNRGIRKILYSNVRYQNLNSDACGIYLQILIFAICNHSIRKLKSIFRKYNLQKIRDRDSIFLDLWQEILKSTHFRKDKCHVHFHACKRFKTDLQSKTFDIHNI